MKRLLMAAAALLAVPSLAAAAPYLPIEGSPNSIQSRLLHGALNLDDVDVEGAARFTAEGDADVIGGAFTHWDSMGMDGERYEGRYQKAWRPFEGQRSRVVVDLPVNILSTDGESVVTGGLSVGVEMPLNDNWSVTPRAAIGLVADNDYFGGGGEVYMASLSSRYRFPQVGRGDLVLGNMIGVSKAEDDFGGVENVTTRNGLAYQWPLQVQMFGRQSTARLSVTHTFLSGDDTFIEEYVETAASIGVRTREANARNRFEMLRFGLIWTHAEDFDAGTALIGWRF